MPDDLDALLNLVAEGRLSPEEAAPLVAALQDRQSAREKRDEDRRERRQRNPGPAELALSGKRLRIVVTEGGRSLVNLQMPVAAAGMAIDRIPGLSPDDRARIVDAIRRGMTGPIVEVRDDDDEVRITIE